MHCGVAPKRAKDNCVVIFGRLHDTSFNSFSMSKFVKFAFMTLDAAIYSNPPSGIIMMMDMTGFGMMHVTKLKIRPLSVFFRYLQEALPVKLKNIHLLNTPYFIDKIMAIIRPLMNDHVNQLLIFHKKNCNMDEFFEKYIAKELLPEDFGGDLPSIKDLSEELVENLKGMETYFTVEEDRRSTLKS